MSTTKQAKANVEPVRQRTQYSCMAASMAMCLRALGHEVTEDEVNAVMGARPMKGAAWEQALATAQHYGCRATLTMPSTVEQLKAWTDDGVPVMIAWNPEGRPWSHASVVFDVDKDLNVYVADPNIPNPKETVRIVSEGDFYGKWYEKFPDYLVRRPACAIEREITVDGKQVNILAGDKNKPEAVKLLASKTAAKWPDGPMTLRDNDLLRSHYARWEATTRAFTKTLAQAIQVPGVEVDDAVEGSVMLNIGPMFGTRYVGLHFQIGGGTVPNAKMLPSFGVSFFPSFGGRRDWPNIPMKDIERDLSNITMKVPAQAWSHFGKTKTFAGGSAAPGRGTTVYIPEDKLEDAWRGLPQTAGHLGKAVSQALKKFGEAFKVQKNETIEAIKTQLDAARQDLEHFTQAQAQAKSRGDDEDERWYDIRRNEADLTVLRLQEQLKGLTKMASNKPSSKWDHLGANAPFGWATPARNVDGSVPIPWRVAHADRALAWLKGMFPKNPDIYTDYESDLYRGRLRIVVGLRDNRDKQAHEERLMEMFDRLREAHFPVVRSQGGWGYLMLIDDLPKDVLRGARMAKKGPQTAPKTPDKGKNTITVKAPTQRNDVVRGLIERGQSGQGKHKNKQDYERGRARNPKHRNREMEAAIIDRLVARAAAYSGNPDGKPIYDVKIDHGEHQALAGGWDIMKRLQDQYRIEQGNGPRDPNPRLAFQWPFHHQKAPAVVEEPPTFKLLDVGAMVNKAFIAKIPNPEKMGRGFFYKGISFEPAGDKFYANWERGLDNFLAFKALARQVGAQEVKRRFATRWNANTPEEMRRIEHLARRFLAAQGGEHI